MSVGSAPRPSNEMFLSSCLEKIFLLLLALLLELS